MQKQFNTSDISKQKPASWNLINESYLVLLNIF